MKILLVCKGEYRYSFPAIANTLRSLYGCEVAAMAFTSPVTRMLERTGAFEEVHNLAAHLKKFVKEHELESCLDALRGTPFAESLSAMIYADRIVSRYPFETVAKILAGALRFWENLLTGFRPDTIVGEIACATEWIGYSVARNLNISYLMPYATPVANRFFFIRSPQGDWRAPAELYSEIKQKELSPERAQVADDFLRAFRSRKSKPGYFSIQSPLRLDIYRSLKRVGRIPLRVQTWLEDGFFEVGSYHGTPPWESAFRDLTRPLRHVRNEGLQFQKKIPRGRKVYFSLHVQPEYTTDVRAPFCTNQFAIVENIAKSVPLGYRVAVKEHPGMKGERPASYYRQFKRLYNVDLLSPSLDSHDLIVNSDVNLTITGTTAWESILYEKPVIAFGHLCYSYFDLVYECNKMSDLPALMREAIEGFRPNRDLLLKFLWSVLATAHTFQWGNSDTNPAIVEKANLQRIAAAVLAEVRHGSLQPDIDSIPVRS